MNTKNPESAITHLIGCGSGFCHRSGKSDSIYPKLPKRTIRISDRFGTLSRKGINTVVSVNGKCPVAINGGLLVYGKISELKSFMKTCREPQICNNTVDMNLVSEKIVLQKEKLAKPTADLPVQTANLCNCKARRTRQAYNFRKSHTSNSAMTEPLTCQHSRANKKRNCFKSQTVPQSSCHGISLNPRSIE